ncbi:kielin/chordin-like protein [Liolophura sinensis]|uniref:kielin/chordin-like protein n=1 Tax=Liolophura sinensis TaxID=3198878 RepID=UPI0031598C6F
MASRFLLLFASGMISALVGLVWTQNTPAPLGCTQNGKLYRPGQEIFRSRVGDWCYGTTCSPKSLIVRWDDFNCGVSSNSQPVSCVVNGKVYQPGDDISESRAGTWCYGKFCDLNGHLVSWNNYDCAEEVPPTFPPTTSTGKKLVRIEQAGEGTRPLPSTTSPPTTLRRTCLYNGVTYQPGEQIPDGMGCGFECSKNGELLRWPCTTTSTTTLSPGCLYNGVTYQPGEQIPDGMGCGFECSKNGELLRWPCTTTPTTTLSPGCLYNGVTYQPGQQIPDGMGCGFECSKNGELLRWPCTTKSTTTLSPGCLYNGVTYQPGQQISDGRGCGFECGPDGQLLPYPCTRPTSPPIPPTTAQIPAFGATCMYNGVTYQPGQQILRDANGCGFECGPNGELLAYPCQQHTIVPITTPAPSCFYNGQHYAPGQRIPSNGQNCGGLCSEQGELLFATCVSPPTTRPTSPVTCSYNGVTYSPGQQIPDGSGCGFECSTNGELLAYPCPPPTTTPVTIAPNTCVYEERMYQPGESFGEGKSGNWCYGMFCDNNGEIVAWDDFQCGETTPPIPTTEPTTTPRGCYYNGTMYQPGSTIHRDSAGCGRFCNQQGQIDYYVCTRPTPPYTTTPGGCVYEGKIYRTGERFAEGREGNWCYGMYCGEDGQAIPWDNFQCGETTTPIPTTIPSGCYYNGTMYQPGSTIHRDSAGCGRFCNQQGQIDYYVCTRPTPPYTTTPGGCVYEGKIYRTGERFAEGREGNWCYGMYCGEDGQAIPWDNFQCGETTTPIPTTIPSGCYYNGTMYQPGSTIHRDSAGCGRFCNQQGQIDYYVCTRPTPPYTTTPHLCIHEGKAYRPGERFGEGREGNWCYGMICGENGETLSWDNFQCGKNTTTTFTSPSTSTRQQGGCMVDGKFYKSGEEISRVSSLNMCYGTLCDENGDVIAWEDFTCGNTGNTINPQDPVKDCQYKGQSYKPGQKILLADSRGCKVYCSLEGRVRVERFPCITPVTGTSTKTPNNSTYAAYICSSRNGTAANGTRLVICTSGFSPIIATSFLSIAISLFAHLVVLIFL